MSEPRPYAQLRLQWLQRVVRDYEPPEAQFEAEALQILRFAFRYAIGDVQDLLRNPHRDRGEVLVALRPLSMSRRLVRQEDVPALIELARAAREVRGPGSQHIEGAALEALVEVADEDVLPFLAECFRYSRARDSAARHRRTIVLKGITAIAVLTRNEEALALLDEALTHKTWRVRQAACRAIREVGGMSTEGLPPRLIERLRYVARNDESRDIRVSAQLALEESGAMSGPTTEWMEE